MTKRKATTEAEEPEEKSYLDKLTDLRTDIKGQDGLTRLLDILIDAEGGDSEALAAEIADGRKADDSRVNYDPDDYTEVP